MPYQYSHGTQEGEVFVDGRTQSRWKEQKSLLHSVQANSINILDTMTV